ncbi:MAG: hypothetical protein KAI73_00525 [Rhodospirillaceae bacterium]|nr:hypothetical protein [Rhodospirillaceae bacterium]
MSTGHQSITDIEILQAPWNKQVTVQEAVYEGGYKMIRLRIKEGKSRFTDLELDSVTAKSLSDLLASWVAQNPPSDTSDE